MTRIIEFLIALGIVAGLFVIIGVCLPGERHITESIETNRKMTIVYDTVSSLRRFKDWNPLVLRDPAVELKLSGPASGVGATLDFTSKDLGTGSWKITEMSLPRTLRSAGDLSTKRWLPAMSRSSRAPGCPPATRRKALVTAAPPAARRTATAWKTPVPTKPL